MACPQAGQLPESRWRQVSLLPLLPFYSLVSTLSPLPPSQGFDNDLCWYTHALALDSTAHNPPLGACIVKKEQPMLASQEKVGDAFHSSYKLRDVRLYLIGTII